MYNGKYVLVLSLIATQDWEHHPEAFWLHIDHFKPVWGGVLVSFSFIRLCIIFLCDSGIFIW